MPVAVSPPVSHTLGVSSTWADWDISSHVPAEAEMAIIQATAGSEQNVGARMNGSTDVNTGKVDDGGYVYLPTGIGPAGIIELYAGNNAAVTFYLVGYLEDSEATAFVNSPNITPAAPYHDTWNDINVGTHTGGETSSMAFIQVNLGTSRHSTVGVRENGSTDNRTSGLRTHRDKGTGAHALLDANEVFELYLGSGADGTADKHVQLKGYATQASPITSYTNAIEFDAGTASTWSTVDLSASMTEGDDAAFTEIYGGSGTSSANMEIRRPGSTFSLSPNTNTGYAWAIAATDATQSVEVFNANPTGASFYLNASAQPPSAEPPPEPVAESASLSVTVTPSATETIPGPATAPDESASLSTTVTPSATPTIPAPPGATYPLVFPAAFTHEEIEPPTQPVAESASLSVTVTPSATETVQNPDESASLSATVTPRASETIQTPTESASLSVPVTPRASEEIPAAQEHAALSTTVTPTATETIQTPTESAALSTTVTPSASETIQTPAESASLSVRVVPSAWATAGGVLESASLSTTVTPSASGTIPAAPESASLSTTVTPRASETVQTPTESAALAVRVVPSARSTVTGEGPDFEREIALEGLWVDTDSLSGEFASESLSGAFAIGETATGTFVVTETATGEFVLTEQVTGEFASEALTGAFAVAVELEGLIERED